MRLDAHGFVDLIPRGRKLVALDPRLMNHVTLEMMQKNDGRIGHDQRFGLAILLQSRRAGRHFEAGIEQRIDARVGEKAAVQTRCRRDAARIEKRVEIVGRIGIILHPTHKSQRRAARAARPGFGFEVAVTHRRSVTVMPIFFKSA